MANDKIVLFQGKKKQQQRKQKQKKPTVFATFE